LQHELREASGLVNGYYEDLDKIHSLIDGNPNARKDIHPELDINTMLVFIG